MPGIDDALDAMPARDLERLRSRIDRRLRSCLVCNADGAIAVRVSAKPRGQHAVFSMMLCPACIDRNRLPESRADTEGETR